MKTKRRRMVAKQKEGTGTGKERNNKIGRREKERRKVKKKRGIE